MIMTPSVKDDGGRKSPGGFAQEVLNVTATGQFHERLDFTVNRMVDLDILDVTSIIDNRQQFTLDNFGIMFDLEEAMNVRRTLFSL